MVVEQCVAQNHRVRKDDYHIGNFHPLVKLMLYFVRDRVEHEVNGFGEEPNGQQPYRD